MTWFRRKGAATPAAGKSATTATSATTGPTAAKPKKSALREWLDAILFAAVVAVLLRTFLLEAFFIPTPSMERSMLVGDFLFVSKLHYGPRLPMTPLAIPFVHNKLPFSNVKSFLDWIQLPYVRIPGFVNIDRNDVVVFNYPADDIKPNNPELGPVTIPTLKENYIKRCVGIPGDTIQVINQVLYVNGQPAETKPTMQASYLVRVNGEPLNPIALEKLGFRKLPQCMGYSNEIPSTTCDLNGNWSHRGNNIYAMQMTPDIAEQLKSFDNVVQVERAITPVGAFIEAIYPQDVAQFPWNADNYGPVGIPQKGATIQLTPRNIALYQRCIVAYEGHTLEQKEGKTYIDGAEASSYTFGMDYYWMMGDNRNNSEDSRFFGFVPEDHIVGKPLLVLFSFEGGFRGERFFSTVK